MRLRNLLIAALFCMITLISCTSTYSPQVNRNLLCEDWMRSVNLNAKMWTYGADRWFFTGESDEVERYMHLPPSEKAVSMMAVNVPQFTNVNIHGCFRVQIAGGQERNSVFILGPNESVHQIAVRVQGDTVTISESQNEKGEMANLKNVIVRIGVRNLCKLKVTGAVNIEGRMISSNGLDIYADNSSNILLTGRINLRKITNDGSGTVTVMGAYTPCLSVVARGSGVVNVCGRVAIQSIDNLGSGCVNIIGADSRSLVVRACRNSKTAVAGYVNLKRLYASDDSCVHIYWVYSDETNVEVSRNARVGLAGCVRTLNLSVSGNAHFGGQYLHSKNITAQTHNNAHANISGERDIFASATESSSIYYFGSSNNVSRNVADHATIIPVWSDARTTVLPTPAYAPRFMTAVNDPR